MDLTFLIHAGRVEQVGIIMATSASCLNYGTACAEAEASGLLLLHTDNAALVYRRKK